MSRKKVLGLVCHFISIDSCNNALVKQSFHFLLSPVSVAYHSNSKFVYVLRRRGEENHISMEDVTLAIRYGDLVLLI